MVLGLIGWCGVADLVAQLMGGDRGQHVALEKDAAQHRQIAGLHGGDGRRLPKVQEGAVEEQARRGPGSRQRPSGAVEGLEAHGVLPSERMARAGDDRDAILEERLLDEVTGLGRAAERAEDEVDVAAAKRRREGLVGALHGGDVELRVPAQERRDRGREDLRAAEGKRAHGGAAQEAIRHFIGAAMLPQSPGVDPKSCLAELDRCVEELGFVAINLNPDPSGGHWSAPPLSDRTWYPIYERMEDHDIPAMIHVSTSCNPSFHTTGAHYLNADTTAFMQCLTSDLFKDFPTLRFVIPHGGGAVPYHWGRFRGLAQELGKPPLTEHLLGNIFFDTCVYHQAGMDLLTKVIPVDNVLFASEMIGAVRGIDPETGRAFDDTRRFIEAAALTPGQREQIFERNARRIYPRLNAALDRELAR